MRDDDLELRAIEERFAAEWRAGQAPRLASYLERYPAHAAALADFAAALMAGESSEGPSGVSGEVAAAPSPGTLRALDTLFGTDGVEAGGGDQQGERVAEQRVEYVARGQGLRELARRRGVSLGTLAEAADLPVEALAWLDSPGGMRGKPPAALLARLAAAMGIAPSRVAEALRQASAVDGADEQHAPASFAELITAHPALTPAQRERWRLLLASEDEGA